MPLHVNLLDQNDEPRSLCWGGWHLTVLTEAMIEGTGEWIGYPDSYTFEKEHRFEDPADGEQLTIMPGETVTFSR